MTSKLNMVAIHDENERAASLLAKRGLGGPDTAPLAKVFIVVGG
jgi:hypothetical protein